MIPTARAPALGSLATATVTHIDEGGVVHVAFGTGEPTPVRIAIGAGAPTLAPGTEVVVLVEPDRPDPPVIVSTIAARIQPALEPVVEPPIDKQVEVVAQDSLVLRCGEASIELRADGTIELYGTRIDSHAEGIQRIKGAQVRIN